MVLMFGASLLGFGLLGWLSQQPWFYSGLGVNIMQSKYLGVPAENNALALLLFLLAVPVFSFFITPLMSAQSRRDEFEADAYAMQQADGAQLASALLKLYEDNASTLTPDPWYVSFTIHTLLPWTDWRACLLPRAACNFTRVSNMSNMTLQQKTGPSKSAVP